MTSRVRIPHVLALAAALLLVPAAAASADRAYDRVASAYAQAGGQLDPCAFTQPELEAAIRGIPPAIRSVVPALRRAMEEGVAAHEHGACGGQRPEEGKTGGATPGAGTPTTTTPPVTTPAAPTTTATAPVVPAPTTTVPPVSTAPAPATAQPAQPAAGDGERDRTPLLVALVAVGVLLLLGLLLWGAARLRGWDPSWAARVRHGWSEAGFRSTSTWSEFTDWLRLGR